jgi:hypothetical protein
LGEPALPLRGVDAHPGRPELLGTAEVLAARGERAADKLRVTPGVASAEPVEALRTLAGTAAAA